MPNGLLLVDKPVGVRSAECVAWIKRFLDGNTRVGHAGTLDSTASGLLIVLLGTATRVSDYAMKLTKIYEATVKLGLSTDTCDASGRAVFQGDASKVDDSAFDRVLCSFWGVRMQYPPEISALKIDGKAAHRWARQGKTPNLTPRPVAMTSIRRRSPLTEGRVEISVTCGKGTYIRSLVRDIGMSLGCGAHVEKLRRLSIGPFNVSEACAFEELRGLGASAFEEVGARHMRPLKKVGASFHRIVLTREAERGLSRGLCVPMAEAGRYLPGTVELKSGLCVEGEEMMGFADMVEGEKNALGGRVVLLKPKANLPAGTENPTGGRRVE